VNHRHKKLDFPEYYDEFKDHVKRTIDNMADNDAALNENNGNLIFKLYRKNNLIH